jgi:hypothetical protein
MSAPSTLKEYYRIFAEKEPLAAQVIHGFRYLVKDGNKFYTSYRVRNESDWKTYLTKDPKPSLSPDFGIKVPSSLFLSAIYNNDHFAIEEMLLMGVNPNVKSSCDGAGAMHYAFFEGNFTLVKKLVTEHKMELNYFSSVQPGVFFPDDFKTWLMSFSFSELQEIVESNDATISCYAQLSDLLLKKENQWKEIKEKSKKKEMEDTFFSFKSCVKLSLVIASSNHTPFFQYLLSIVESEEEIETKKEQLSSALESAACFDEQLKMWIKLNRL